MAIGNLTSNIWFIATFVTIGGLLQGFDVACLTSILGTKQYVTFFGAPGALLQGGITASMAGGSMLGCLASSPLSEHIGRRDSLIVGCVIFVIGSSIMAAVQNVPMLIAARIINGFGVGFMTTQAPMYLAEISPVNRRGRLISFQSWMMTIGEVVMSFVSYGTSFVENTGSFRIPWALQMVPAMVMGIMMTFLPRSPRWLVGQDRWEEARRVLVDVHGNGDEDSLLVIAELNEIRDAVALERSTGAGPWRDLVKPRNILRVHVAIFAHIWCQFTGGNAIMYYVVYIMEMAGLSGNIKLISASIQYVVFAVIGFIPVLLMDRWRLRHVMIGGSLGLAVCHFVVAAVMATEGHYDPSGVDGSKIVKWIVPSHSASSVIIAFIYIFIAIYALTWSPVSWIYPPSCIPLAIRSKTIAVATFFNWGSNFAQTFFTPIAFVSIEWKFYIVFGTICTVSAIHIFLLFPETQGKTLEEMDEIFSSTIWGFKTTNLSSRLEAEIEDARDMKARAKHVSDIMD